MPRTRDIFDYLGPRYRFIGFDESTLHTEYQSSQHARPPQFDRSTLRLKDAAGEQPGQHRGQLAQEDVSARCLSGTRARSNAGARELYDDAVWPSDKYPLQDEDGKGFSVAFIPGRLTDHHLLDDKYIYRLRMMSGSLAPAMEKGCWCELEGMYFSFLRPDQVVDLAQIEEHWWENHIISLDFGFGKSAAAAGLFSVSESGRMSEISTLVERKMEATEVARAVCERFIEPTVEGHQRRIVAVYLDPSNFKHIGTGPSVAQQMQEVFQRYHLLILPASNDRIAGWQMLYRLLKNGRLVLTKCNQGKSIIFDSLSTRMHHEKIAGDVMKVAGDELDDVADMVRYAVLTWFQNSRKPNEVAIEEKMEEYREAGLDQNSLNIYRTRLEMDARKKDQGGSTAIGGRRIPKVFRRN